MFQLKASIVILLVLVFVIIQILIFLQPTKFTFLPTDEDDAAPQMKNLHSNLVHNHDTHHDYHDNDDHRSRHYMMNHSDTHEIDRHNDHLDDKHYEKHIFSSSRITNTVVPDKNIPINEHKHQGGSFDVCNTFNFVPANWTLFRKAAFSAKAESKKCQNLYASIFKNKLVKQIVRADKTVKNLGCSKKTKSCAEGPYFDTKRNIRINSPPCCMRNTKYVLKTVTSDLKRSGIPHMLFGGAVLGWSRNRHLVPYDNDQDVWMDGKFWRSTLFKNLIREWNKIHGFKTQWKDGGNKLWVLYSSTNGNGLDLYPWYVQGGWVKYPPIFGRRYDKPYDIIFPLKAISMDGVDTYMPSNPHQYCEYLYGKGWMKEMTCKKVSRKKCYS